MTKKEERLLWQYLHSNYGSLYDAYKQPSWHKIEAWEYIKKECNKLGGYDLHVTGKNTSTFSCAYTYVVDGEKRVRYHTAWNTYDFERKAKLK